jgi:hypothetical protein
MTHTAIINALTTREQRAIARRNYRLTIDNKKRIADNDSTSESGSDFELKEDND